MSVPISFKKLHDLFGPGNAEIADLVADFKGLSCACKIREQKGKENCKKVICESCCKGTQSSTSRRKDECS